MSSERRLGLMIGLFLIAMLLSGCIEIPAPTAPSPKGNDDQAAPAPTMPIAGPTTDAEAAARAHLAEGLALKDRGDLDEAVKEYTAAIEQDPFVAEAYYQRGYARYDLGDLKAAIEDFDRAIGLDPALAIAFEDRALAREESGDLSGAMMDYNRAIELDPVSGRAYTNRAIARRKLGDVAGAIGDHTRAIDLLPDTPKKAIPFFNRGNALQAQGDLDGAVADFTRAIELDPEFVPSYINRAGILQAKDVQAALKDYNKALELPSEDDDCAIALSGRGFLYLRSGNINAAARDFGRAVELNPDNARAHAGMGYITLAQGRLTASIEHFNRAIELDPKSYEAYTGRAAAHEANSQIDLSIEDMLRGLALLPDDEDKAAAYIQLGSVCAALGDWKRAALAWSEALKLEPTGKLHADRGSVYMKIGAYDQAAADFRAAALLDPDNAVAHANLAWVLVYHLGANYEEALRHAQRAVELAPDAGRHDTLALAYHKTGQLQKALEQYGMAVQLNPLQVESYKRRGDVYRELGDRPAALADYQQYLKLAPRAEDRAEVETLVRSLLGR
jgi:tetratricopeptide (TPR) repeat protein